MEEPKDNTTIFVKLGQNKTIKCVAYARGNVHFQLLRVTTSHSANGTKILQVVKKPTDFFVTYEGHDEFVGKNIAIFHFENITKKDLGYYTCMAGNSMGYATTSFKIQKVSLLSEQLFLHFIQTLHFSPAPNWSTFTT